MINRRRFIAMSLAVMAFGITGCSGIASESGMAPNEGTITPYSLSHGARQLWFKLELENDVEKDEPAYLYVFENGRLTYRSIATVKMGDLRGKSDEEVEAAFADADKAFIDAYPTDYQSRKGVDYYVMNEPYDISATIVFTDGTGNNAKSEQLAMYDIQDKTTQYTPLGVCKRSLMETLTMEFTLPSSFYSDPWTIYENSYGGFKVCENHHRTTWFVTRLNPGKSCSFELDAPGTEGLQTQ